MKRRHRGYILAVALLCVCALVAQYVTVSTNYWVVVLTPNTSVHYGLYRGHLQGVDWTEDVILTVRRLVYCGVPSQCVMTGLPWLATVVCLAMSGLAILMAITLAVLNFTQLPASRTLSIWALCCWIAAAGMFDLLAFLIWGIQFILRIKTECRESQIECYLGFSCWGQLGVLVLLVVCVAILKYRETLFYQRPKFCIQNIQPPPLSLTMTCGA